MRKVIHKYQPKYHTGHSPHHLSTLLFLVGYLSMMLLRVVMPASPTSALTLEDDRAFSVSVDYSMGIVLSSTNLTIPIYPTDTGQFGRTSTSVYVDTNNIAGYTLTLQSNTDKLTNTKLGTTIDPLDSPLSCTIESDDTCDTFPTNTWGYRIGATGSYLPATDIVNKPIELAHTDTVTTTTDPVATLYFGTKIDTHLPTGIYDGVELTFIATANIQKYNVTLLPTAGITSITLDNESPCTDTTKGCVYALEKDSEHIIKAITSEGYSFDSWHNSSVYGSFANINSAETIFTVGEDDVELTASATVNSYTCAKQYRLQSADGTYPATYTGAGTETIAYGETCSYTQSYDNYQTQSTSGTMTTNGLTLSLDLPRNTYTLTMAKDTNISSTTPATGTSTRRWGEVISISATAASGKKFTSWTATAGTLANTNNASTTFTMPVGNATVTVTGEADSKKIGDYTTMQSFKGISSADKTSVLNSMSANTTYNLIDNRDNATYKVAKLADGNLWMVQNLNLTVAPSAGLTSDNTNVSATVSKATFDSWKSTASNPYSSSYSVGVFYAQSGTDSTNGEPYGTLYNYYAASAGTISGDTNSNNATYDICPAGWRLPTGGSGGEQETLAKAYGNGTDQATATALRKKVSEGGAALTFSGYFDSYGLRDQGSYGSFWSRTRSGSDTSMHDLSFNASSVYRTNIGVRRNGNSIRCILQ